MKTENIIQKNLQKNKIIKIKYRETKKCTEMKSNIDNILISINEINSFIKRKISDWVKI